MCSPRLWIAAQQGQVATKQIAIGSLWACLWICCGQAGDAGAAADRRTV